MKKIDRIKMILNLTESLIESMKVYENAQAQCRFTPQAGNDIPLHDSRESMLRRICCIREQLNVLTKQLRGEV